MFKSCHTNSLSNEFLMRDKGIKVNRSTTTKKTKQTSYEYLFIQKHNQSRKKISKHDPMQQRNYRKMTKIEAKFEYNGIMAQLFLLPDFADKNWTMNYSLESFISSAVHANFFPIFYQSIFFGKIPPPSTIYSNSLF